MPGPEECFESKQALNARFRESNRNISPIEKDYHTNLKECKNDILFIAYFTKLFQNMFLVGGVSADVNRFQNVHLQSRVKLVLN